MGNAKRNRYLGAYLKRSTLTHHSQTKIDQEDKDTEDLSNIFNKIDLTDRGWTLTPIIENTFSSQAHIECLETRSSIRSQGKEH